MPNRTVSLSTQSLLSLLKSCSSIKHALQLQAQLFVTGLHHQRLHLSKLISFFALSSTHPSALSHSLLLFTHLNRPNVFICNTIIRAYSRSHSPLDSISIYKSMLSKGQTPPNNFTFPSILNSCANLPAPKLGQQVHCHITKYGFASDLYVRNSLIGFYTSFGDLDIAHQLYDEITEWDPVSFNIMLSGYNKGGRPLDALWLLEEMIGLGVKPDEFSFVSILSLCSVLGDLRAGKAIHMFALKNMGFDGCGDILKSALVDMYAKFGLMRMANQVFEMLGAGKSSAAWSSMVLGYAKCGEIETARRFFDAMPEKDLISWTSMISGYSHMGRPKEALELFIEMEKEGIKPDQVTIVSVLSACAKLGALDLGKRLQLSIEDGSFACKNAILSAAIVDMYAKCGCIGTALEVFRQVDVKLKTVSLYNSIISGLAQHGLGERAIAIFREMECLGLSPDEITFVGVLCACSRSGLIEVGRDMFDLMLKKYGIEPQAEHYGCMVDLLGRSGLLNEAYAFIEKMPISPNNVIWAALLRACRVHRNFKIGEVAATRILELESDPEERDIHLSDMFSDNKRLQDAKKIRKMIDRKPTWKPHGWSYIEWNDSVHQFRTNDNLLPQAKEMNLMLKDMSRRLRLAGYDCQAEQVLLGIDEEENKGVVAHHSEKLALAFGLINFDPGVTIRIVMDLRMCIDCHSSFKLFSDVFSREIIVRDKIRFHHMKNGLCSCMDYW